MSVLVSNQRAVVCDVDAIVVEHRGHSWDRLEHVSKLEGYDGYEQLQAIPRALEEDVSYLMFEQSMGMKERDHRVVNIGVSQWSHSFAA